MNYSQSLVFWSRHYTVYLTDCLICQCHLHVVLHVDIIEKNTSHVFCLVHYFTVHSMLYIQSLPKSNI